MATTTYTYWDDDERNTKVHITYYSGIEEPYIPVYKILKEMYDEEKQALYIYDSYSEYYYDAYLDYECMFDDGDVWSESVPSFSIDQSYMSDSEEQVQGDETASCFTSNKFYYY